MTASASAFAAFKTFWATPPYGRDAYEERPSSLRYMARAAREEDAAAFDAFLLEQLAASGPNEALLICDAADAPAVTDALRARLATATGDERARIAERLAARGHVDEARGLLLEMLRGPDARYAAWPLKTVGGTEVLAPVLGALASAEDEMARRDLRDLALHLAGFEGRLHRTIAWSLGEANPRVRAWGIAALRRAVADGAAGRPWTTDDIPDSPALRALLYALPEPGRELELVPMVEAERLVAAQVLILAHERGDPRARPALQALGGDLARVGLGQG